MFYYVTIDGAEQAVEVELLPGGSYRATIPGAPSEAVEVTRFDAGLAVRVGSRVFELAFDPVAGGHAVYAGGRRHVVTLETRLARELGASGARSAPAGGGGVVQSPMPGKVVQVLVAVGDAVAAGAPVVVVEAMKMENQLVAARGGTVREVLVGAGDNVESGTRLVVIE